jgi:hypothetical protein
MILLPGGQRLPSAMACDRFDAAGTYKIHWQVGSSDAQITLSGNGHQITVPATLASGSGPDQVLEHREGSTEVVDGFTVKETNFTLKTP